MSTHAIIARELPCGATRSIYCHSDGYVHGGVGEVLFMHFGDTAKIDALLDGGDISVLYPRIDAPKGHTFDNRHPGCTVFYARDRGEMGVSARNYETSMCEVLSELENYGAWYLYVHRGEEWFVYEKYGESHVEQPLGQRLDES